MVSIIITLASLYYFYNAALTIDIVARVTSIFVGIYLLLAGIGIFKMKIWSRKMVLIISILIILLICFAFITFMPGRMKFLPSLVFFSLLLFYFLRKKTKELFIK